MSTPGPTIVIAPMTRVDRAAGRLIRERERKDRRAERQRITRADVDAYQALLISLTHMHKVGFTRVNWADIVAQGPVAPAVARDSVSSVARRRLAEYRPSLLDTLLGLERDKRRRLNDEVMEAVKADAVVYARALAVAEAHNRMLRLEPEVRALKPEALAGVLKACPSALALGQAAEGFMLQVDDRNRLVAFIDLLEFDALPDEACVANGPALSKVPIPHVERCELQLANACSVALRAAVEVLQIAPVEAVEVVARRCPPEGRTEADMEPVLYLKATAAALGRLKLRELEAPSTVAAMGARIDWNNVRGLAPIAVDDLDLSLPPAAAAAA